MDADITCKNLPNLVSSFVDTFVDFCVTGTFLPDSPSPPFTKTFNPSPNRLIAIGDLHGDFRKSKQALRLAGLIDSNDKWSGGSTTLVQVGDVLDRGGHELEILYLFEKLKRQAFKVGGNVITMNGNHEIMNVNRNFRLINRSNLREYQNWAYWLTIGNNMKRLCGGLQKPKDLYDGIPSKFYGVKRKYVNGLRARIAALRPKGPISTRFLSKNLTVVVVGESVFVHGGILPHHVAYGLNQINEEVRDWIMGSKETISSDLIRSDNSVVWLRNFSNEVVEDCDRHMLEHVLGTIPGAKRMIMGHTIQECGINAACDNKAIRIDVGMSKGCGNGPPEVLEISENSVMRVLTSNPLYDQNWSEPPQLQVEGYIKPNEKLGRIKAESKNQGKEVYKETTTNVKETATSVKETAANVKEAVWFPWNYFFPESPNHPQEYDNVSLSSWFLFMSKAAGVWHSKKLIIGKDSKNT